MIWINENAIKIPKHLNEKFFIKCLEEGLRVGNIKIKEISVTLGCDPGENYCSGIYRMLIKFNTLDENLAEGQQISLIVKTISMTDENQFLEDVGVYITEKIIYSAVLPRLEVLMDDIKFGADFFYATKSPIQTMVFKDLTCDGFKMASRQAGLDWQHCSLILQQLGRFHATSMVLAKRDFSVMQQLQKGLLCEETLLQSDMFYQMFEGDLRQLIKISKKWPGYSEISEKLQRYYNNFKEISYKLSKKKRGDRIFVLNHGDAWVNNFMFAYENKEKPNLPTKSILLDFQYSFYGSPACDLNFFFNTSVPLELLRSRRDDLIGCYYKSFAESLQYLRYSPVPSMEDLQYELHSRELYGFFGLFGFLSMVTMPKDLVANTSIETFANEEYKTKMLDVIYDREELQQHFRYSLKRLNDLGVLDEF